MKCGMWSLFLALFLGVGCRESDEMRAKEMLAGIQPGMSRERVREVLGKWGRRHFWKMEQSRVPEGRTEARQREFETGKKRNFRLLVPDDLLETIPLANGTTEVDHYVFNKHSRFAVGYQYEDLMFFYEAGTELLLGYGYDPHRVAGRSDLEGTEFFFHGKILAP